MEGRLCQSWLHPADVSSVRTQQGKSRLPLVTRAARQRQPQLHTCQGRRDLPAGPSRPRLESGWAGHKTALLGFVWSYSSDFSSGYLPTCFLTHKTGGTISSDATSLVPGPHPRQGSYRGAPRGSARATHRGLNSRTPWRVHVPAQGLPPI